MFSSKFLCGCGCLYGNFWWCSSVWQIHKSVFLDYKIIYFGKFGSIRKLFLFTTEIRCLMFHEVYFCDDKFDETFSFKFFALLRELRNKNQLSLSKMRFLDSPSPPLCHKIVTNFKKFNKQCHKALDPPLPWILDVIS